MDSDKTIPDEWLAAYSVFAYAGRPSRQEKRRRGHILMNHKQAMERSLRGQREWIQLAKAYFLAESTMISIAELQKAIRWSTIVVRPRQAKDAIC